MFGVDITCSFKSRDSSVVKIINSQKVNIRVSFHRCINGEKIAIRLINHLPNTKLSEIGYSSMTYNSIMKMIHSSSGIICFVGPTGHGKTTSMYSSLSEIDLDRYNVMSVEDPVEMYVDSISQTNVNDHPDMNFVDCLKSIMRQDPDIIVIGEIRDSETASMAIRAAMSGHKVFTTLHAKDIVCAIDRFYELVHELGINKKSIIDYTRGMVAQRLIRFKNNQKTHVISEALCFDAKLRSILNQNDVISDCILNELRDVGHVPMFNDGMSLVKDGLLTEDNLLSIVDCVN